MFTIIFVAMMLAIGASETARHCSGAIPEREWTRMKNSVERLDENVDRLNEKCGVDPTKAERK
jgi:hypothetical protein